jgi:hypothetical protein
MKQIVNLAFILLISVSAASSQESGSNDRILSSGDLAFLAGMTKEVIDSSRISPGQIIAGTIGPNNTGGILIRPGGRNCYPSFWIRDYAMSLESGFITPDEQKHMLILTASVQCDQPWITRGGSMIPYGAIADHIRIDDGLPVFFPGTLDYLDQGNKTFGMVPPYDDQFFFIHMAWYYLKITGDYKILDRKINNIALLERLRAAFSVPPAGSENGIVYTTDEFRGVDFGFRDVITMTGELCMTSILKCRAAFEMADILSNAGEKNYSEKYKATGLKLKKVIPEKFGDGRGMLKASTGKSGQADVWSTALAVWFNILEGDDLVRTCRYLADAYKKGILSTDGNIRHIIRTDDFSNETSWQYSLAKKEIYQNGAYWGTATGWVCYAIAKADPGLAKKLAGEYISDLRKNDFRKGGGAPYECFHPSGFRQNPVYMTTVTCPYIVFTSLNKLPF